MNFHTFILGSTWLIYSLCIVLQLQGSLSKPLLLKKKAKPSDGKSNNSIGESNGERYRDKLEFDLDKIQPPDHLAGLKMERDGHVNKEFHQEVVLGNVQIHPDDPEKEQTQKLTDIFYRYSHCTK